MFYDLFFLTSYSYISLNREIFCYIQVCLGLYTWLWVGGVVAHRGIPLISKSTKGVISMDIYWKKATPPTHPEDSEYICGEDWEKRQRREKQSILNFKRMARTCKRWKHINLYKGISFRFPWVLWEGGLLVFVLFDFTFHLKCFYCQININFWKWFLGANKFSLSGIEKQIIAHQNFTYIFFNFTRKSHFGGL